MEACYRLKQFASCNQIFRNKTCCKSGKQMQYVSTEKAEYYGVQYAESNTEQKAKELVDLPKERKLEYF